jgi:hypothetical protein
LNTAVFRLGQLSGRTKKLGGGVGDPGVMHYQHTIDVGKEKVVALCAMKACRGGDNSPTNCECRLEVEVDHLYEPCHLTPEEKSAERID